MNTRPWCQRCPKGRGRRLATVRLTWACQARTEALDLCAWCAWYESVGPVPPTYRDPI